ncbi:MAG: 50S ribosomal protein L13 [Puniceicoccales bacterium]|jgi:large subunit ribosomal protein L13|nr:50S ribosomal protein L13 [Puniceicoccales bacterium]
MTTTLAKKEEHALSQKRWFLFDASSEVLGRMAVRIANILRGRHNPYYTPHVDTGDYVIVINAEKVLLTGNKNQRKNYMFYTGYMGNEWRRNASEMRKRNPRFLIEHAVKGMLPKNRLAEQMLKKLKVYAGANHEHQAQNPIKL